MVATADLIHLIGISECRFRAGRCASHESQSGKTQILSYEFTVSQVGETDTKPIRCRVHGASKESKERGFNSIPVLLSHSY